MNLVSHEAVAPIHVLSDEESREMFEQATQHYFQISGEEFLWQWDAGEFGDPDSDPRMMRVAMLIPLVR